MEYVYAVKNESELSLFRHFLEKHEQEIEDYVAFLKAEVGVHTLPRTIVLTSRDIACGLISDIPVPAYTNDFRVIFTPSLEVWRGIYLKQLDEYSGERAETVRQYYKTGLSERHVLQILGHELAHHSDWFSDEAYERGGAWFEEGMVEYISRKYFLTEAEFEQEAAINRLLVDLYEQSHPPRPLTVFGKLKNADDYATLYVDYWRAFIRVRELVDSHGGDAATVLREYGQHVET